MSEPLIQYDKAALSAKVRELMDVMAPVQAKAIDRVLRPVYDRALKNWPVRKVGSKDSRGKLALTYTALGDGKFKTVLTNTAPYAWFIHGNRTAQGLILTPAKEAAKKIAAEVVAEFEKQATKAVT